MPVDPDILTSIKFFELLDEEDRKLLGRAVDAVQLQPGQRLFDKGDRGEALFIVREGKIELSIVSVTGEKIILNVVEAGDLFGELSLADGGPRTATAVALVESDLIVLSRENLLLFFQKKPDAAMDIIAAMGSMVRKADDLLRTSVSKNVNEEVEEKMTPFERMADWIAWFGGSMPFLLMNTSWFIIWIGINTFDLGINQFDPYPFGLLTMIVSLEAIFLSIFVLISQNRQAEKDRVRSNIDYEVNVKAELEIAQLHENTERLHEKMLEHFARLEKMLSIRRTAGE